MITNNISLPEAGLVLVAGRPGIGKSYAMIEMARELNSQGTKAVLVYADTVPAHDIMHYKNGESRLIPSKLSRVQKIYPDIPYVAEDLASQYTPYEWQLFLNDYIGHEHPKAMFINSITTPHIKPTAELFEVFHSIATTSNVLIFAEINVSSRVVGRKDKHPKPSDIMCPQSAHRYVDGIVFVYRETGTLAATEHSKTIEIYTSIDNTATVPFCPEKYSLQQ